MFGDWNGVYVNVVLCVGKGRERKCVCQCMCPDMQV